MKKGNVSQFAIFITSLMIVGCSKLDPAEKPSQVCGVSSPLTELAWLKNQYNAIKDIPQSGIVLYKYNSKEVVEIQSSLMSSTNMSQYYCDGTKLNFDTPQTYKDYQDFLKNRVKIMMLYGVDIWN